ncbi:hypothetical protein AYI69_g10610, partial [Smittium culicis]
MVENNIVRGRHFKPFPERKYVDHDEVDSVY